MEPLNAVAAASHPDPYPYYRRLREGPPLVFDPALGYWIASRAAVIEAALTDPACRVRPVGEAVPDAIAGSSAGALFARLVRMNDGARHAPAKRALGQALQQMQQTDRLTVGRRAAHLAAVRGQHHGVPDGAAITRWMFDLPTQTVAHSLGFAEADLPQVAQ